MSGDYSVLSNRLDWAEYYIENELHRDDPFLRHPDSYSTGISLIQGNKKEPLNWSKIEVLEGVILVQKTEVAVEFSFFGGQSPQILLNHLPQLNTFTGYFKQRTERIRKDQHNRCYRPPVVKSQKITPCMGLENRHQFLNAIRQEKVYLNLVGQDLTTKEIAERLTLSPRTVESYLNMIRNKLDCDSKRELVTASKKFIYLGLTV